MFALSAVENFLTVAALFFHYAMLLQLHLELLSLLRRQPSRVALAMQTGLEVEHINTTLHAPHNREGAAGRYRYTGNFALVGGRKRPPTSALAAPEPRPGLNIAGMRSDEALPPRHS